MVDLRRGRVTAVRADQAVGGLEGAGIILGGGQGDAKPGEHDSALGWPIWADRGRGEKALDHPSARQKQRKLLH